MSRLPYDEFSRTATGNRPYDYQRRLACDERNERLEAECNSQLINVPTGLGKTAAVVLAWLWNCVQLQNPKWPRRPTETQTV